MFRDDQNISQSTTGPEVDRRARELFPSNSIYTQFVYPDTDVKASPIASENTLMSALRTPLPTPLESEDRKKEELRARNVLLLNKVALSPGFDLFRGWAKNGLQTTVYRCIDGDISKYDPMLRQLNNYLATTPGIRRFTIKDRLIHLGDRLPASEDLNNILSAYHQYHARILREDSIPTYMTCYRTKKIMRDPHMMVRGKDKGQSIESGLGDQFNTIQNRAMRDHIQEEVLAAESLALAFAAQHPNAILHPNGSEETEFAKKFMERYEVNNSGQALLITNKLLSTSTDKRNQDISASFLCPITLEIMRNPAMMNDGNNYEYTDDAKALNNSPLTRAVKNYFIPNIALRECIHQKVLDNKEYATSFFSIHKEAITSPKEEEVLFSVKFREKYPNLVRGGLDMTPTPVMLSLALLSADDKKTEELRNNNVTLLDKFAGFPGFYMSRSYIAGALNLNYRCVRERRSDYTVLLRKLNEYMSKSDNSKRFRIVEQILFLGEAPPRSSDLNNILLAFDRYSLQKTSVGRESFFARSDQQSRGFGSFATPAMTSTPTFPNVAALLPVSNTDQRNDSFSQSRSGQSTERSSSQLRPVAHPPMQQSSWNDDDESCDNNFGLR
jgi:hypothetical protein